MKPQRRSSYARGEVDERSDPHRVAGGGNPFGYRVDYGGRSVVLSGDTRVSENLVRHAQGADVLVHEVIDPQALRDRPDHPSAAIVAPSTRPNNPRLVSSRSLRGA